MLQKTIFLYLLMLISSASISNTSEGIYIDIEEHDKFDAATKLLDFKQKIKTDTPVKTRTVGNYFHNYMKTESVKINNLSMEIFNLGKDPLKNPELDNQGIREMTAYMLVSPKTSAPVIVYRGIFTHRKSCEKTDAQPDPFSSGLFPVNCIFSRAEKPKAFVSTSLDKEIAHRFKGSDLLIIHLPRGFPFYPMENQNYESEILLPTHILNKSGKLVPIEFEIDKAWSYTQSEHNVHVKNAMEWDPLKESLLSYEARYATLACNQITDKGPHIEKICSTAISYYHQTLH